MPEAVVKVINILRSSLQCPLPKLDVIARQLALSESTLKRQFKDAFGKSIYGFYLDLKMDHAKQLMQNMELSVNQVAERLGYENVSNFIEMFKKRHGYSPGSIKRNKGLY